MDSCPGLVVSVLVSDSQAEHMAFHNPTTIRTKNIRLRMLSRFDLDRKAICEGDAVDDLLNGAIAKKSAGDELDRFGADWLVVLGLGGAKRKDFVDQVFTRLREVSEVPSSCKPRLPPSARKPLLSVVGVDGGVRGEANTSNWCER